jgi:hypothetical protein
MPNSIHKRDYVKDSTARNRLNRLRGVSKKNSRSHTVACSANNLHGLQITPAVYSCGSMPCTEDIASI